MSCMLILLVLDSFGGFCTTPQRNRATMYVNLFFSVVFCLGCLLFLMNRHIILILGRSGHNSGFVKVGACGWFQHLTNQQQPYKLLFSTYSG